MDSDSTGGARGVPPEERLNAFALVIYIPGALGAFLDDLRRELVPHYNPHAHVSVLPPRPLTVAWQKASEQVRAFTGGWAPFAIELKHIEVFPVTDVIYIGIGSGARELRSMHAATNTGALAFEEPFSYYPHITLAQEIPHEDAAATYELARRRWSEFKGQRVVRAERVALVQNTMNGCWIDLAEYALRAVAAEP